MDFQRLSVWLFLMICTTVSAVRARDCYFCTYGDNGAQMGQQCINDPENYTLGQNTVTCQDDMHCFVETRVDTMTGVIYTFGRGCGQQETVCEENPHFRTCIYTCDGHLCNTRTDDVGKLRALPGLPSSESNAKPLGRQKQQKTSMAKASKKATSSTTCYSCTYSYHPEADTTCITDPESVETANQCSSDSYGCYTMKQWDKGDEVIRSFGRGCQATAPPGDDCLEDTHWITCHYYCDTDLCNDEDLSGPPPTEPPGDGGGSRVLGHVTFCVLMTVTSLMMSGV